MGTGAEWKSGDVGGGRYRRDAALDRTHYSHYAHKHNVFLIWLRQFFFATTARRNDVFSRYAFNGHDASRQVKAVAIVVPSFRRGKKISGAAASKSIALKRVLLIHHPKPKMKIPIRPPGIKSAACPAFFSLVQPGTSAYHSMGT